LKAADAYDRQGLTREAEKYNREAVRVGKEMTLPEFKR
jgi:hypothetical protein